MGVRASTSCCRRQPRSVPSRLGRCRPRQRHRYLGNGVRLDLLQAVKIARNLLPGGRGLRDARVYPLLAGGSLIDVFLYGGETLLIERGRSEGRWRGHVQRGLRNGCQPAELQGRSVDQLSGSIAARLPSQGGNDTDTKRHKEAGHGAQVSL